VAVLLVLAVLTLAGRRETPATTDLTVATPTPSTSTPTAVAPAADPLPATTVAPVEPDPTVDVATPAPPTTLPARPFTLVPTSGRSTTRVAVSGTDCTGHDAGVGVAYLDSTGQIGADSTMATSDGTWVLPVTVPAVTTGPVTVEAFCFDATTNARYFSYAPQTFLITR
jgi:hypothetical protein